MKHYNKNGINILIEQAPKTPRISINLFFKNDKKEKYNGVNSLLARLLLQGTKTKSASQLNDEFEKECIDISFKAKQDYIKASLIFLNEDLNKALELLEDLILNSTFDDFEKEVFKIKGEIISDLDNPKIKLTDCFIKNIFKNHPYSQTHTKILDDLEKITKQDVIEAHKTLLQSKKAVVFVGDYEDENQIVEFLTEKFAYMTSFENKDEIEDIFELDIKDNETIWLSKNDASQAQIIQGCLVDSFGSEKCAKIAVLNNILGSCGLSSRLFINLRDKQGLAYTVRSQYETLLHSGIFNMYIGTAPKNIEKSLNGFREELQKFVDFEITDEELQGARENIKGRIKYFSQNNSQISSIAGYNFIMDLGLDYNEKFLEEINKVTKKDVQEVAREILDAKKLTTIIAPDEYKI
ncbi:MAG: insulinase family protein [Candidatus Gastranaerophilales bacterium]|nr:insulinase family protein [Candidatus Gastranaerophilales bacterium]